MSRALDPERLHGGAAAPVQFEGVHVARQSVSGSVDDEGGGLDGRHTVDADEPQAIDNRSRWRQGFWQTPLGGVQPPLEGFNSPYVF